jgi:putative flippase GtrA
MSTRFIKFVLVSGIAALANIGSRIVFNFWMAFIPAILLAFCVGLIFAFTLNRFFVFRKTINSLHRQALWFTVVNLAAIAQTLAVSLLMAKFVFPAIQFDWHPDTVAHAMGVAVPVVTSFFGHKHLSFRERD